MKVLPFLLLALAPLLPQGEGGNILFYWAVSGMSHRITVWPLVERLVEEGHNVTFLSPLPSKKPNPKVHDIILQDHLNEIGLGDNFLRTRVEGGAHAITAMWGSLYFRMATRSCNAIMSDKALVSSLTSTHFDLIVINAMLNDCAYGLVHYHRAPFIIYGTTHPFGWWPDAFGYPDENYPEFMFHFPEDMTFLQSVVNALTPLYWQWNRVTYMLPDMAESIRKGLPLKDELPPLGEIETNVSLVLMNTHPAEEYPRSLPPLFVPVGGMHCSGNVKQLSSDIEEFIAGSQEGFIYFSLGTFANPEDLPQRLVDSILNAMGNTTSIRFLVKWFDERTAVKENVRFVKWISQQDVLAHPRIRLFISHGGLLGTQEALFHGVPMIVLPLFAEQDYNANRIQKRGRGLSLDIQNLSQEELEEAIQEILRNESYGKITRETSKVFKDRPMSPVDTAQWWVEYVLRHNETPHLRPIGMQRNWFTRRQLHVWTFILAAPLTVLLLLALLAKRLLSSRPNNLKPLKLKNKQH